MKKFKYEEVSSVKLKDLLGKHENLNIPIKNGTILVKNHHFLSSYDSYDYVDVIRVNIGDYHFIQPASKFSEFTIKDIVNKYKEEIHERIHKEIKKSQKEIQYHLKLIDELNKHYGEVE